MNIHNDKFPFDNSEEEREIIHVSPRKAGAVKLGAKFIALAFVFAGLMFGAKYLYDLGRGTPNFADAPLIVAKSEPYKFTPKEKGGMKIPNMDKQIYANLDPNFEENIDKIEAKPLPQPEEPMTPEEMSQFNPVEPKVEEFMKDLPEINIEDPKFEFDGGIEGTKSSVKPVSKPKTLKLNKSGVLVEDDAAKRDLPEIGSKKIDVSKVLARKKEAEIWVQLGTFASETEATKSWQTVSEKNSDILKDAKIKISKSDLGAKGTYYRLQSGPYTSESKARDLCKKMNEREQNCFFVKQEIVSQ